MTTERYREQLERHLRFLQRSAAAYDRGFKDEAIRIAVSVRVLVHQTKTSTSLLRHLGADDIELLSTVLRLRDPAKTLMFDGVTRYTSGPRGLEPTAHLGSSPGSHSLMPVADWWHQILIQPGPNTPITRRDIVLGAANKDGGAHVDAELTPEYSQLAKGFLFAKACHQMSRILRMAPMETICEK